MRCSYPQRRKIDGEYIYHACGNCRACRKNRAREWGFRAYAESTFYKDSIFLSLTYDDEHLPVGSKGYPTLRKADLQTFWKDFRYYVGKCRYLASGEYGEHTHRPHYHCIVFGVSLDDSVFTDAFYSPRKKAWIARCKAWPYGEVCIGNVTIGSCMYCAKYTVKRKTGKLAKVYYDDYGIEPEFATMSRRPGLGYQYLLANYDRLKRDNFIRFKGHKIALPRYFVNKLYEDEKEYEAYKHEKEYYAYLANLKFWQEHRTDLPKFLYMKRYLEQQEINLEKQENMKGY